MKKVCVITGGTGGLGYAIAHGFHYAGFQVVVLDYMEHRVLHKDIYFIRVDLQSAQEIEVAFQAIKELYNEVHVLVNNAAVASFHKSIYDVTVEELDHVFDINLRGAFLCAQAFVKLHTDQTYGRIIQIASTRWYQNEAGWDVYGASKGGLVSLTHSLCVSLQHTPITVNTISPGWIEVKDPLSLTQQDHDQHPSRRVGRPDDIVRACLFLADEGNDFINGHNLIIDGGMSKRMIYEG